MTKNPIQPKYPNEIKISITTTLQIKDYIINIKIKPNIYLLVSNKFLI